MKTTIPIFIFLLKFSCFGQNHELTDKQYNESGVAKIRFAETIQEAENLANLDIKAKTPFLLTQGGIAPVVFSTDREFRKVYGVYYYDFGCLGIDGKISTAYNNVIFNYLSTKYGKEWMSEIRKDVLGFKQYKKIKTIANSGLHQWLNSVIL